MRFVFGTTKAEREDSGFKVAMETIKGFDNPERLFIVPVAVKPFAPHWPCDRRMTAATSVEQVEHRTEAVSGEDRPPFTV